MISGYYFITDSGLSRAGAEDDVRQAVAAGVRAVQYRDKTADTRTLFEEALKLRRICGGTGTLFVINDRVDIALATDADGVHLGQSDLPCAAARKLLGKKRVIGVTAHSLAEALRAQDEGADYIGVAPVFSTATKSDAGVPLGLEGLKLIRKKITIPIAAIGGITLSNAVSVLEAGADAFCAISAVLKAPDVQAEIRNFQALCQS